jgi:uncharacterized protein YsxB (DUF464 family)
MIRVKIDRDSTGRIRGFEAKGHAGAGSKGKDIVCAAVSVLTDSVFLGLDKHLQRAMEWNADHGDISIRLKEKPDELTEAILATMVLGLTEIQKIYPDKLRIL